MIATTCMSYQTGGPGKEHGTDKLLPTRIKKIKRKEVRRQSICSATFPESFSPDSILAEQCTRHQEGPCVGMIGQKQPGNSPHHHKTRDCEPRSREVLLGSLTLRLSAQAPLRNIARVSPRILPFWVLDQSPASGPWKGSAFLQHSHRGGLEVIMCNVLET